MLVQFCGGYVNPERVEAVMPSTRGGYMLAMRSGSLIGVCANEEKVREDLEAAGMLQKLVRKEEPDGEK